MLVIRVGIPKGLVRIAKKDCFFRVVQLLDPDEMQHYASSDAVWSGSAAAQFVKAFFGRQLVSKILEHLSLYNMNCTTSWSYYPPSLSLTFYVLKVANVISNLNPLYISDT